jgi:hypothetical protein
VRLRRLLSLSRRGYEQLFFINMLGLIFSGIFLVCNMFSAYWTRLTPQILDAERMVKAVRRFCSIHRIPETKPQSVDRRLIHIFVQLAFHAALSVEPSSADLPHLPLPQSVTSLLSLLHDTRYLPQAQYTAAIIDVAVMSLIHIAKSEPALFPWPLVRGLIFNSVCQTNSIEPHMISPRRLGKYLDTLEAQIKACRSGDDYT